MTETAQPTETAADLRADMLRLREEFPALHQRVRGRPLVYLDNAATTHKPRVVLEAMTRFYAEDNSNIHRGVHALSVRATEAYEQARSTVARFLNAPSASEIVFLRGTTEAINLIAHGLAHCRLRPGDEVLITHMEHHSNIVPWQMACEQSGATLKVVPITDTGELEPGAVERMITDRTRVVSVVHVSNSLGTVNPVREICALAHKVGAVAIVDGAQAVAHMAVDVQEIGCDAYAFSGHKLMGPTGVGALWARQELLAELPPYQGGGDMIEVVTFEKTTYAKAPAKFEAGTPNISGAVGLGAAVSFIEQVGLSRIHAYEAWLLERATEQMQAIPGIRLIGTAPGKAAILAFTLDTAHPHDIGTILDMEGVAIRTGHHCTQPVMVRMGVPATARASLSLYNTQEEIDILCRAVNKVKEVFH
jgi:cysteine desulfurase/selenocysteine lyase